MKLTNKNNLPGPLVRAVEAFAGDYEASHDQPSDISVTSLLDAPQVVYLKSQHYDEIEEDVSDRIWSLMGAAMHLILERAADNDTQVLIKNKGGQPIPLGSVDGLAEDRLYADWDGWVVSGQYDYYEAGVLTDYKLMSVWEVIHGGLKPEKTAQLNVLKWLAEENGMEVNTLQIVSIYRDWSKNKAKFEKNFPQEQSQKHAIEIWSKEEVEAYISERIALHKQTRESGKPPRCSKEEQWARPDVYAVMVTGQKRAKKLHDNEEDAISHAKTVAGGYVEYRPGEKVRCQAYCPVSSVCPQCAEENG